VKTLLIITGWAHGAETLRPLADRLRGPLDVQILSAAEALAADHIPAADAIVGWSMGGTLALERLPASCRALVLIASTACFCSAADYGCGTPPQAVRAAVTLLRRKSVAVLPDIATRLYHPYAAGSMPLHPGDLDALTEGMVYLFRTDLRERIQAVRLPVLLLHGSEDALIPPAASSWLHQHLPDSRLELIAGEGHALPLQKPDVVAGRIRSFLAAIEPSLHTP
jgi:pimeloyl-[acyl-carrier protein] methyl ester esterase